MNNVTNSLIDTLPHGSTYGDLFAAIGDNLSLYTPGVIICAVLGIVLSLGLMIIMGIFGDYIYKKHCVNAVKESTSDKDSQSQHEFIAKKGGVNLFLPIIAYGAFYFANFIISIIII